MASLNQVTLLGNCTRDPELRYTPSGTPVCTLGLAINSGYGTGENRREETCFIDVTCFGRIAEIATEYLVKGSQVLIIGRLSFEQWEGSDGQRRTKHKVIAEQLQLLGRKDAVPGTQPATAASQPEAPPKATTQARRPRQAPAAVADTDLEDDIPF